MTENEPLAWKFPSDCVVHDDSGSRISVAVSTANVPPDEPLVPPNTRFVPGHGGVAGGVEMRDFRDYLDDLRSRVKKGIADGLTIEQAKKELKLPDKYTTFGFQNFAQPNIEDMYKELKGTKSK